MPELPVGMFVQFVQLMAGVAEKIGSALEPWPMRTALEAPAAVTPSACEAAPSTTPWLAGAVAVKHVAQAMVPVVVMVPPVMGPVVAMLVTVPVAHPATPAAVQMREPLTVLPVAAAASPAVLTVKVAPVFTQKAMPPAQDVPIALGVPPAFTEVGELRITAEA